MVISNSASGIGGRWDTFQARLREQRKEAVAGCATCGVGPGSVSESERVQDLKKAVSGGAAQSAPIPHVSRISISKMAGDEL